MIPSSFRKYLLVSKTTMMSISAYPVRFFSVIFMNLFLIIGFYFLWKTLYGSHTEVKGFTLPAIVTYYVVARVFDDLLSSSRFSRDLSTKVRNGNLSPYLIKPLDYNKYAFSNSMTKRFFDTLFPLIFLVCATLVFQTLVLPPQNLPFFVVSVILGILVNFFLYTIIGITSFWFVNNWGVLSIIARISDIMGGTLIPLAFFPVWLATISIYLPFKYMVYVPLTIYVGTLQGSEMYKSIVIQFIWIIILFIIFKLMWKKGIRKYDSVGN